jgi:bifunctional non-homologous end joining protein LigD
MSLGKRKESKRLEYVVQQHKAKNKHYDMRLEYDGKMLSWAIPKGPSNDPKETRSAFQTAKHDMDYNTFEGIIAKGQYGAGKVQVWDKGTYTPIGDMRNMINNGMIKFELNGDKLKGKWALIKINHNWILKKMKDQYSSISDVIKENPKSVKSGKLIQEINEYDGLIKAEEDLGRE